MNSELSEKIITHLQHINYPLYCTLSTIDELGLPWGAPVYFASDERGAIYWSSAIEAQHSINLQVNKSVFVSIFKEGLAWATGDTYGLYLRGNAVELIDIDEVTYARQLLCSRVGVESTYPESFLGDTPRRVYKFTPEKAWTNQSKLVRAKDGGGHMCDERVDLL